MEAINQMVRKTMTTINIGTKMDKTEMIVAKTSSRVLTTGVPIPAVATSTTGLATTDFAACTEPATNRPQISESTGWISVIDFALAANKIAPAVGRINVWMASLM